MKTIWKFELDFTDRQTITAPGLSKIIAARIEGSSRQPFLLVWAEVHTDFPEESLDVLIYGTGHDMEGRNPEHVTTLYEHSTGFVWHVYQGDKMS